jgi:glycosyltransferase involved in cell wall biosynthesis
LRPTISVVIPAYNSASFVGEAITSVLTQTVPATEIVVVDDGSTDDTAAVAAAALERAPATIRTQVIRQLNGGVPVARNTGLLHSSGEFVTFLDADDLILPDHFRHVLECLAAHPEAVMAFADTVEFDGDGDRPESVFVKSRDRRTAITAVPAACPDSRLLTSGLTASLLEGNYIPNSTTVIRREALSRSGAFDPVFQIGEDRDLYLRLSVLGPFVEVGVTTGRHRLHPSSVMATRDNRRWALISLQILAAFRARFPELLAERGIARALVAAERKWHRVALASGARRGLGELHRTVGRCRELGHSPLSSAGYWFRAAAYDLARMLGRDASRDG